MNKNLKKLGLLVVTAIAMAMGVNSASALKIGDRDNNFANPVTDNSGRKVNVVETAVNTYTITVEDSSFNGTITIIAGENVTINLNGKTLASEVYNNGTLTFAGDASSYMIGTLHNNTSNTTLNVEGGNYARMKMVGTPAHYFVRVIGTVVPSSLAAGIKTAEGFKSVANRDNTVTVAEADADMHVLQKVILGTASKTYPDVSNAGSNVMLDEAIYTKSSFGVFKAAYETAKALVDENNANPIPLHRQGEIDAAVTAYVAAYRGLEELAAGKYATLDALIAKIQDRIATRAAEGKRPFTNASMKAINDAIAYAQANHDLPKSRKAEVQTMIDNLQEAWDNREVLANYSKINELEDAISVLNPKNFTAESWANLVFVQSTINRDLSKYDQDNVDQYYAQLKSAFMGLKASNNAGTIVTPGDDEPSNPGTTEPSNPGTTTPGTTDGGNNNSGTTVNPNTGATGTTSDVNTSDNVAVYAVMNIASLIALAGCGLVLRKQN